MAINMTKEPSGIYPAYNDSFLEFTSDLAGHNRAEITVYPVLTFPRVFLVYPDLDGNYLFNLKEAVKFIFNKNGFKDSNFDSAVFWKSITGLYLLQQIQIKVYNDATNETLVKNYEFFKAVKQIAEPIYSNPSQLLTYTPDGVNHFLTYFEGFPFHFDVQKVALNSVLKLKSLNTSNETPNMTATASDSFRIAIDRGGANNWTDDNILPLIEGLNKLELYKDGVFQSNVIVTKKKKCSGVFLKWFNRSGGFSHFLFNEYFIEQTKSNELGKVYNDELYNIGNATGLFKSTGKQASASLILKSKYESTDYENLKDIFTSPLIQMYTSKDAYIEGSFIDVSVDGTISFNNKKGSNDISLIVELPEKITAKL